MARHYRKNSLLTNCAILVLLIYMLAFNFKWSMDYPRKCASSSALDSPLGLLSHALPNLKRVNFSLPCNMYYLNMEESMFRRGRMESTYRAMWGPKMHRLQGVKIASMAEVRLGRQILLTAPFFSMLLAKRKNLIYCVFAAHLIHGRH
jgi:hypothetical protein